ncbi:Ribosomal protein L9, N-terminal domain [Teratosphaeria destructans]|uniref:Ribosomal protein L9, N-terminal domain n=1 Tax=Teratosphaeria destructans TaxID=418781 RepID=A0A9W7SKZ6_9PEZI|nr:Ribosomal protein L9, N-terminal domain [Teratosphaeria destructans]
MSLSLSLAPRPTQCWGCLRNYALLSENSTPTVPSALRQHVRGKKKLANTSKTVPVRLLKDVKTFGRKDAIVPIAMGQMRNVWFPRGIAAYVTLPEQRMLRLNNVPVQRDFNFDPAPIASNSAAADPETDDRMSRSEVQNASMFQKKAAPERIDPERSIELIDIFVPPTGLEFYRQPIMEEKESEPVPEPEKPKRNTDLGLDAGAELLAARASAPKSKRPQAIYGSVSTKDVLTAVKAALATNDEASRVALHEEDVQFVDMRKVQKGAEADRVKHVGDYVVEIGVKGVERRVRRPVKVIAQESA